MKGLSLFLICLAACLSQAQVKMSVEINGKKAGTASLSQRIAQDGAKSVELRMDLEVGKQKLTIRSQNSYDRLGNPVRKFMDSNIPGGALQKQIIATFDDKGANIVQIDGGKRTTRQIPLVSSAPRANAGEFWFLKTRPKTGDQVKCYMFNMDTLSWQLQTTVYRGLKSIKIGGKTVEAHEVETIGDRTARAYLDDKGLPWMLEAGGAILRRIEGEESKG